MSGFYTVLVLLCISSLIVVSEGIEVKKTTSAVVVGTVYCDTCFLAEYSRNSHFISGATVAVECRGKNISGPKFHLESQTNKHGVFKVDLPFSVRKYVKKIKRCSVELLSSSDPYCTVASTAKKSSLHLKSRRQRAHIFSAGSFTFKPQTQPNSCNQKPSMKYSKDLLDNKASRTPLAANAGDPTLSPPLQGPSTPYLTPVNNQFYLPPLPLLPKLPPLPQLPPLPPLPGLPYLPPTPGNAIQEKPDESSRKSISLSVTATVPDVLPISFPTNPEQSSPLIRNPLHPSTPLIPDLPPIPGLTPSPPSLSFPFPTLQPSPPGITRTSP